jgi:uncharacterized protein (DUF608 family)
MFGQQWKSVEYKRNSRYTCVAIELSKLVTDRLKEQDTDDDGLVDNGGFADQTYDAWTVVGARFA